MRRLSQKEAESPGTNWMEKVKTFSRFQGGKMDGFFDTSAGFTYADKVSIFILALGLLCLDLLMILF